MTAVRPVLLLAGLIGYGSVLVSMTFKPPAISKAVGIDHATSDDGIVSDRVPTARQMSFRLDHDRDGDAVLVISSREAPRQLNHITINLETGGDDTASPLTWRPFPAATQVALKPILPVTTAGVDEGAVTTPVSPKSEQWFLPSDTSTGERTVVVQTLEVADAPRVRVVLDKQLSNDVRLQQRCRQFAVRMHTALIPTVEAVFGPIADRRKDRKLTVVVTPQVRQKVGGDSPIDAFVLATDFREDLLRPRSNECDAIYVHPELSAETDNAILIHELTHAAQFCAFRRHYGTSPWPLADWILEGSAHAAESLLTDNHRNVKDRLDAFAAAPERSPLRVVDSTREKLWRDSRCRGAACSFFTWLGHRYGMTAVGQIVTHQEQSENVWHAATGINCDELVRDWRASLIANRSVRLHDVHAGQSLTLTIQGGAAAYVRLPNSARGNPITVRMESPDSSRWESWVHREGTKSTEVDYWGAGVAFTSPVTTIR